jgi:hypothetical protein
MWKKKKKIEKKAKIILKIYWNKYLSFLDIYKWLVKFKKKFIEKCLGF